MPGIVAGYDGSDISHHALEWAISEAAIRQTPLTVLTVHQAAAGFWGPVAYPGDEDLTEKTRQAALKETELLVDKLDAEARPPSVSVMAVNGMPAEELLRAAERADMVVVGSRGAGGFRKLLMGSVSLQVTHHAHCPIVVIPDERA